MRTNSQLIKHINHIYILKAYKLLRVMVGKFIGNILILQKNIFYKISGNP